MALCREGLLSLVCFSGTLVLVFTLSLSEYLFDFVPNIWGARMWGPLLYYIVINISLRMFFKDDDYQIAIRATFLGFILAVSLLIFLFGVPKWQPFGAYGSAMAVFHYSEYLSIAWTNPQALTIDSFILNHSLHYAIAAVSSWVEYVVEVSICPAMKEWHYLMYLGICMCVIGEVMRKLAIFTANSNFNHVVQITKAKDHRLVTNGIYGLMRHPSYVGWFWWSIGTQVALSNPICTILYTAVSWKFFKDRIYVEEITLLNFFSKEYIDYQNRVPTGLPFIEGFLVEHN